MVHRRGSQQSNANALSRLPCRQCGRSDETQEEVAAEAGPITVGALSCSVAVSNPAPGHVGIGTAEFF